MKRASSKGMSIWFFWFVSFVWFNRNNQTNQTNQINRTNWVFQLAALRASPYDRHRARRRIEDSLQEMFFRSVRSTRVPMMPATLSKWSRNTVLWNRMRRFVPSAAVMSDS